MNFYQIVGTGRRDRGMGYTSSASGNTAVRRPWKAAEAVQLVAMDVVIAGVGYLL